MYVIASPEDSKRFYPENNCSEFTLELPKHIDGSKQQVALTAVYIEPNRAGFFIVYSDVCEDGTVDGHLSKVFGVFYKSASLPKPVYLNISRHTVQRIRFKVQGIGEEPVEKLYLVIHFKEKQ